jgi:predicted Zn-dependent peptidase
MKYVRCAGFVVGALLCGRAVAADGRVAKVETVAPSAANLDLPSEKFTLANGLEVILHEDHRTPTVTVNVWYHVGSKDEEPGRNGFAHLFEHVMFQGSKHVGEDLYFKYLERAGASSINGTTNTDRTNYFETVPANQLELGLWLESDRMGFLLDHADDKTFKSQREVVKNERRQNYENAPYGMVHKTVIEHLYPESHPYYRTTIGTPEDLDRATIDDVRAFFKKWYVPNNATLSLAGDFESAKVKPLVEKYFGDIPKGDLSDRRALPDVKLEREVRLQLEAGVELGRVSMTWPSPKMYAEGDAALDLVSHVLSGGKTSRLYKALVYDARVATDVSAHQSSAQLGSRFEIGLTLAPGKAAEEAVKIVDRELARLASAVPTAAELSRAKVVTRSALLFSLEKQSSRADMLNHYNQVAGRPDYFKEDLARYARVSANEVKAAAKTWLPLDKRVVAIVVPTPGAPVAGRLVAGGAK